MQIINIPSIYKIMANEFIHIPTNKNDYISIKNKIVKEAYEFSKENNLKLKIYSKHDDVIKAWYSDDNAGEIKLIILDYEHLIWYNKDLNNLVIIVENKHMTSYMLQTGLKIKTMLENKVNTLNCGICDSEELDSYTCTICGYMTCKICAKKIAYDDIFKCPQCRKTSAIY